MMKWNLKKLTKHTVLLVASVTLVACGSSDEETPIVTPSSAVIDTAVVTTSHANDVTEVGEQVSLNLEFNKALLQNRTLTVHWLIADSEVSFHEERFDVEKGATTLKLQLDTVNPESERYDTQNQVLMSVTLGNNEAVFSNEFELWGAPPAAKLFNSNGFKWYTEQQASKLVDEQLFQVIGTDFTPWPLPADPTWHEDPYDNNTWLLYYHSLGWLYGMDYAYEQTGDAEILERIEFYILDYLNDVPRDGSNNYMAWNDHAVAWRFETLTYLYQKYFRKRWHGEQWQTIESQFLDHADELVELLHDDRYYAHNHSMYHALSLYNFSFALPRLNHEFGYRHEAETRINELFDEMVNNKTGVSVEQSTSYHFIAMELFVDANQFTYTMTGEPMAELADNLAMMADFAAHFIYRNGNASAMGDSNYDRAIWLERLQRIIENGAIASSYTTHLSTAGESGTPLLANYVAADDGYVIQRPGYDYARNEIFTFTDFGKKLFSHGHHDAGNVIATDHGAPLLIDSGGPYLYNSPKRAHFRSAYAHNTLIVDEQATFANDASVLGAACIDEMCYSLGLIDEASYQHWRLVVTQRDGDTPRWSVIDIATSKTDELHAYKLVYHFPDDADVVPETDSAQCQTITLATTQAYCMQVAGSTALTVTKWQGVDDATYTQGWVQPGFGKRIPAPVLEFTGTGQQLLAVTELRTVAEAHQPMATVQTVNAAAMTYTIELGRYTMTLNDLASPAPTVHVTTNN
ncbi:heparinase II/III domain-containing protein [Pseudidiomarina sediminum]|uniref:heparinase II/III domain-containing protein n=1 Tax=Pseudidiomarina sediminum TaxID=431675 RepID=UPI001C95A0FC|nr:heparinase II/III family protein [Pseudidiomarina sediminum]MBY6063740.1 heparinase II/III-family protein [Pseudidiomarina sediminum]